MRTSLRRFTSRPGGRAATLADLSTGEGGVIEAIDLPPGLSVRLMELGFLPGSHVIAGGGAPRGDPRVYRVDGTEVALRRETALRLRLRSGERT